MQYFNFNRLIDKYSCEFTVITQNESEYDDLGEYKNVQIETVKTGAIIGISENKIYRSDGALTQRDKELFVTESLGDIVNVNVIYDGCKYSVEAHPQDNHKFTGVWQYTLKWVSAFNGGDTTD